MIYLKLFYSFFLIGLFAIGGGAATVPFLFDLSKKYSWFSTSELTEMIAISESTPGPIGVNMATFAGFKTTGILGGIVATFGLVLPSFLIVIFISKMMQNKRCNLIMGNILKALQPAIVALVLNATVEIGAVSLKDLISFTILGFMLILMRFYRTSPIFYIIAGGFCGYVLKL